MTRSFLFIPADSHKKLSRGLSTDADALILDLEDSVALAAKDAARRSLAEFLNSTEAKGSGKRLYVRINPLQSGLALADLVAVMPAHPYGIVLPKSRSGEDVRQLHHYLDALELANGRPGAPAHILAIVTEVTASLFRLDSYRNASARLWGVMWGAEDLSAELGALENRVSGQLRPPYELARSLCLYAAAHAGVVAVDAVPTVLKDVEALTHETVQAKRDGFLAKAAVHPDQLAVINRCLAPSEEEIGWARRVISAFEAGGDAGTISLDGTMLDRPHLQIAQRMLGGGGK